MSSPSTAAPSVTPAICSAISGVTTTATATSHLVADLKIMHIHIIATLQQIRLTEGSTAEVMIMNGIMSMAIPDQALGGTTTTRG